MIHTFLLPILLSLSPGSVNTLQQTVERGEQVFTLTCATGYCHAINGGAGGGGARLAARGFSQEFIRKVVDSGRPGTAMLGFRDRLPAEDLQAVVAYVATLNGIETPLMDQGEVDDSASVPEKLSTRAVSGRVLFHDSLRAFARCSTCHQVQGSGVPVAESMAAIPANASALRGLQTPAIATFTLANDAMPALAVSRGENKVLFYDLTVSPPVLRSVNTGAVTMQVGSGWRHSAVVDSYSDKELELILHYLHEIVDK